MKKHFVVFMSPGTFCAETSEKEIDGWDTDKAKEMAKTVIERYGAKPYGFYFITKERKDHELDSKVVSKSNMYYLGGKVKTLEEVKKENKNKEHTTLISNMECNGWDKVIFTNNSYSWVQPLNKDDIIL